jgi:hypothetical protein
MKRLPSCLLLLLWILAPSAWAEGPKVAVFPFEIYNAPDLEALAPGLQSMLASRLAGEGYSVVTTKDREPGDAQWTVRTTITHLGQVYSVDAALTPLSGGSGSRSYETVKSADALLGALDAMAKRLKEGLARGVRFAVPPPVSQRATPPPAPPSVPYPATIAPPAPPTVAVPAPPTALTPPATPAQAIVQALSHHRAGPAVSGEGLSLVVADVDKDGTNEILLLSGDQIRAFRDFGNAIQQVWAIKTPTRFTATTLSAGDVDGNGLPELFVAGLDGTRATSQAMEWTGTGLADKGEQIPAFVRAVPYPGRGTLLLGRVPGAGKDLFSPEVRRFEWKGRGYEEVENFPVPAGAGPVNVDWFELNPGGAPYALVTSQMDRLEIYNPEGKRIYQSNDTIKGSMVILRGQERVRDYMDEDLYRVEGKTVGWKDPQGQLMLLTAKNYGFLGRVFDRTARFNQGQIQALTWDGLTLLEVAQGPKIPDYVPDLDIGPTPGRPDDSTLYVALVQSEGLLFKNVRTLILAFELPSAPAASATAR